MQKANQVEPHQPASRTDWERLRTMTDEDIQRGIDNDPDSAPILSDEQMRREYKPHPPRIKR